MMRRCLVAGFHQREYWVVNLLHRVELSLRNGHPLGDQSWNKPLLTDLERLGTPWSRFLDLGTTNLNRSSS
jgi:hypothetical protein